MQQQETSPMKLLMSNFAKEGIVEWIGVRPGKREDMIILERVIAKIGSGLEGDRFRGSTNSPRQVTLIQKEHIQAVASFMKMEFIQPFLLRRNIVVSGINLLAFKEKQFQIGDAILEMSGLCHPCSRMEEALGAGGYNAMRGHGGITAKVIREGEIRLGDQIKIIDNTSLNS
ncbi:MOSC domain-containing protein [Fulvivirgaceae bacterium BMA10]|uniref:MOSC domain-containing protein n=1 Tax=Splendidivirga corallicola TaxID=3051826 RepID=A0ABT8KKT3_9BACT|nr:MOSC domain-containing protein [Fulvivirgaceae bacterium BMA10]